MLDFAHFSAPQFLRQFEANSFVPVLLRVWVMPGKRRALDHLGAIFLQRRYSPPQALRQDFERDRRRRSRSRRWPYSFGTI